LIASADIGHHRALKALLFYHPIQGDLRDEQEDVHHKVFIFHENNPMSVLTRDRNDPTVVMN